MEKITLKKGLSHLLIVTIIYILGGSLFGYWNLWTLYVVPPAMFYIQNKDSQSSIMNVYNTFFLATTCYLGIGSTLGIWHPTWLIYLLPLIYYLRK
jgi:hypothetical protein